MSVLIDTNILTRSVQPGHPMHQDTMDAVSRLRTRGEELCIISQVLIEFWVVATRPLADNGLDLSTTQAEGELVLIRSLFRFLGDTATIYEEWEKLVTQYAVFGKKAHDARIVAAMRTHGLKQLLTYDVRDFKRYPGVTIISPTDVK